MKIGGCWRAVLAGLALLAAGPAGAGTAPEAVDWPARPMNYTSHSVAFMERLLAGRVWVFRQETRKPAFRSVGAYAFFPDGRASKCLGQKTLAGEERWRSSVAQWWMERMSIGTLFVQEDRSVKPGSYATPMFYFPETGGLDTETNSRKVNRASGRAWLVLGRGWLQEGWPAALKRACPDLPLPEGMAIEKRQSTLDWADMRKRAPDAIVRNFPGSEQTSPGRTGIGRSNGAPTTDPTKIEAWLTSREGRLLAHVSGRTVKVGPRESGERPLQVTDDNGTSYADGRISYLEGGDIVIEVPGARAERIPPGYPLPFLSLSDRAGPKPATPEGPATGTGRCIGDYEGIATWTMGADGKRVWDTSGCKPVGD